MTVLLPIIVLIFFVFFIFPTRKLFYRSNRPGQEDGRKLISSSSLMLQKFGSSRGYKADYYFDAQNLYEVIDGITTTIPLASIVEVKRGTTRIGNRSVWSVDWLIEGQRKQTRFLHNYTLFNQSFATFLDAVKQANPGARVTRLTLFTL
ncbi:hypothetical protein ACAK56_000984 [Salmonella enterica]|nr:hypothetical protein [Salmonella enterica]